MSIPQQFLFVHEAVPGFVSVQGLTMLCLLASRLSGHKHFVHTGMVLVVPIARTGMLLAFLSQHAQNRMAHQFFCRLRLSCEAHLAIAS